MAQTNKKSAKKTPQPKTAPQPEPDGTDKKDAKKTPKPKKTAPDPDAGVHREPVSLVVGHEHVATPHSIVLKQTKDGGEYVGAEAKSHKNGGAEGAKTVESILREAGVELPTGEDKLEITFSPDTGEVVAVVKK